MSFPGGIVSRVAAGTDNENSLMGRLQCDMIVLEKKGGVVFDPTYENDTAFSRIRSRAEHGDINSYFQLGLLLEFGNGGVSQNYPAALKWFQLVLARAGQFDYRWKTLNNIGLMYASGHGVSKDTAIAYAWWRLAETEMTKASAYHKTGDGIQRILTIASIQGVLDINIGVALLEMDWTDVDGAMRLRRAAKSGDDISQNSLGCLLMSKGTGQSEEARDWIRSASFQSTELRPVYRHNLAVFKTLGIGTRSKYGKAPWSIESDDCEVTKLTYGSAIKNLRDHPCEFIYVQSYRAFRLYL